MSWSAVIEAVVSVISQTDDRTFIFPTKGHLDLFHIIKQKCKLKTKSNDNAFLIRRKLYDVTDAYQHEENISIDKMVSIVQAAGTKSTLEDTGYILYWIPRKKSKKEQVEKQTSYIYMGDTRSSVFHELKSVCLSKVPKEYLRGLGKDPRKVGFNACLICLKQFAPPAIPKMPTVKNSKKSSASGKSKAEIMRSQIKILSEEYGMHAEFHGSMVYITTMAGEWYFDYNDRPIRLRHKNAEKRLDRSGQPTGHYHAQPYQFHAPLQVLAYIRNHEQLEVRRLMGVETDSGET